MFAGSLVLSFTLIAFAFWLQWNEKLGWPQEQADLNRAMHPLIGSDLDRDYYRRRSSSRARIHWIIGICGVLILIAAIAGHGVIWVGAWMCVMFALVCVVLLALLDAFRTHRYHKNKLPQVRDHVLGEDS
ncbi:hypothetical protein N9N28_01930 [Rubripirellula amarantea]|uniref:Uncharacterized protein n=1 Tax=Rubripirellula amarantea TaxID=2527999 RepID=A0A5C5WL30_9BACT|nr:hypothetical protein [Rubripirellula amarantea]MDA8743367.1 hypothetical protein [Rubripirellula amarantea]TWT51337.1 hypothetical protein Pla22_41140 [Rubripirellula amarantea]